MIVAAVPPTNSMSLDRVPFGWFDVALVAMIVFGIFRGRKNGMTKEVLPMLHWLATVLVCGLTYDLVGHILTNYARMKRLPGDLCAYLFVAFLLFLLFQSLKKALAPRLEGSSLFGSSEYYLGAMSGMVRFACMVVFALALLNAPYYSAAEIAATQAYNARTYGGGLQGFNGNFFPSIQSIQEQVFQKSFAGPYIHQYLRVLLIDTEAGGGDKAPGPKPVIHLGN